MPTNITVEAQTGYRTAAAGGPNPHLHSSPAWFGFEAGRTLHRTGRCEPIKATMGRGYTVNLQTAASDIKAYWDARWACILERKDR